ncbi:ATP-binding protein [Acinetobacter sp. Marseille-Q1623]|uniref:ATP-binding protein n=1 Tax=Acinetobacter sp. Marseille-Q1623 TaxID=2697501 RepID=UPI00157A7518|nr:ATP-binding protein [Acinetobacter sp. Marseille-Q1623]
MQLIIFTGVQASGKSTFYKEYFYKTHLRLNLDMLKTRHRENILFEAALASKTKMVIDNTNMTKADRARYIQRAKDAEFEVISYYFEADLDSALERNRQRFGKERIPDQGVLATAKKFELPSLQEGFDELYKVNIIENQQFSIQLLAIRE